MLNVKKIKDSDSKYSIWIKNDKDVFLFQFCGNLDLYFSYRGEKFKKEKYHSFVVNKENYFLYKCFGELYDAIINEMPFKNGFVSFDTYSLEHLYYPLVKNKVIEWHSDDGLYEDAAILFIEKNEESYKVTIKEGLLSDINIRTSSVRFRNSGSIYDPYNFAFMGLYNQLCAHNFEYEQITLDEYVDRTMVRKR